VWGCVCAVPVCVLCVCVGVGCVCVCVLCACGCGCAVCMMHVLCVCMCVCVCAVCETLDKCFPQISLNHMVTSFSPYLHFTPPCVLGKEIIRTALNVGTRKKSTFVLSHQFTHTDKSELAGAVSSQRKQSLEFPSSVRFCSTFSRRRSNVQHCNADLQFVLVEGKQIFKMHNYTNFEKDESTNAVRKVSCHFKYLEKRSRGLDVTWQPVRGDLTAHP